MNITYNRHALIIDGKPEFIRSGAMHYFRLPSEKLWRDRLIKLKSAGYNTVDLYFCWDYHSASPGQYDFEAHKDVRKLLSLVEELGLYLIARPGPYINAEYSGGGIPKWLIAQEDVFLRNRDTDGNFHWCESYMKYVEEWWNQIVPIINKCPNLILMQIENEYATLEMEPDYIKALYDMTRRLGVKVPLFHNDLYAAGLYEDVVDIYAFDNYSVTSFDTDWRELSGVFSVLDQIEENFRPFCSDRPLFVAELQAGWYGKWRGEKYEKIVEHLGREHISVSTKSLIGQGLTLFNHYKAIGGTNWDFTGSTATYTSYDFAAPISESGINKESLYETKAINLFLESFDLSQTDKDDPASVQVSSPEYLYAVRHQVDASKTSLKRQWIFLRNLKSAPAELYLNTLPVHIKPHECLILPHEVPTINGAVILNATVEMLYQDETRLVVQGNRTGQIVLKFESPINEEDIKILFGHMESAIGTNGHTLTLSFAECSADEMQAIRINGLTLYALGQIYIDKFWVEGNRYILGPDTRLDDTLYGIANPLVPTLIIEPDGNIAHPENPHIIEIPTLPLLENWEAHNRSPALTENLHFFETSSKGADFDSNGFYEGNAWYRCPIDASVKTLTIDARHIWAVYLNGQFIGQGVHLTLGEVELPVQPSVLEIPQKLLSTEKPNELVIFVDGLGHPKGFHDDARTPQGLLTLEADGKDIRNTCSYSVGFSAYPPQTVVPKLAPVVSIKTEFTLDIPTSLNCPIGLELGALEFERINIYLNGKLMGRHWKQCEAQSLYYLPEGILHENKKANTLELIFMSFNPMIDVKTCAPTPEQVYLKPYSVFTKSLL